MADKLGPGGYNSTQSAINTMILQMNDLEFQRLQNSENEQYFGMQSSGEIETIQNNYDPEIKYVRNEMHEAGDKTSNEYYELMSELEELQEDRDSEIKRVENETTDREKQFEIQDTNLETRINAVKADKEALEDAQKSDIQRS